MWKKEKRWISQSWRIPSFYLDLSVFSRATRKKKEINVSLASLLLQPRTESILIRKPPSVSFFGSDRLAMDRARTEFKLDPFFLSLGQFYLLFYACPSSRVSGFRTGGKDLFILSFLGRNWDILDEIEEEKIPNKESEGLWHWRSRPRSTWKFQDIFWCRKYLIFDLVTLTWVKLFFFADAINPNYSWVIAIQFFANFLNYCCQVRSW